MKIKKLYFLVIVLLTSCNELKNEFIGMYDIRETSINGINVQQSMSTNLASFYKDGSCFIPDINDSDKNYGTWKILKENGEHLIVIKVQNTLAGNYVIEKEMRNSKHQLEGVILVSGNKRIIAKKFLVGL